MANKESLKALLKKAAAHYLLSNTEDVHLEMLATFLAAEGVVAPAGDELLRSRDCWWYTPKTYGERKDDA